MFSQIFLSLNNRLVNDISKIIDKNDSVLDLGCGDGSFAKKLQEKTKSNFTLMDVIDYNKTKLPFHLYDGKKINFPDKYFDKIVLCWVLHHIDSLQYQENMLREAKRVARKSIIIIETTPRNRLEWYLNAMWDLIANKINKVTCPFTYRNHKDWLDLFGRLNMSVESKKITHLMASMIYILSPMGESLKD